jgi:hypothetical protein
MGPFAATAEAVWPVQGLPPDGAADTHRNSINEDQQLVLAGAGVCIRHSTGAFTDINPAGAAAACDQHSAHTALGSQAPNADPAAAAADGSAAAAVAVGWHHTR